MECGEDKDFIYDCMCKEDDLPRSLWGAVDAFCDALDEVSDRDLRRSLRLKAGVVFKELSEALEASESKK